MLTLGTFLVEDTSSHYSKHRIRSKSSPKRRGCSPPSTRSPAQQIDKLTNLIEKPLAQVEKLEPLSGFRNSPKSSVGPCSPLATPTTKPQSGSTDSPYNSINSTRSHSHLRSASVPTTSCTELDAPPVPAKFRLSKLQASADIKSRCEVALESIAAVEKENRKLFERALVAETKAKALEDL